MKLNNVVEKKQKQRSFSEETKRKFSLLLLNTEEPFILVDPDLNIVAYNRQFETQYKKFFGIQIHKGLSILNYAQKEKIAALNNIYAQALKGVSSQTEIEVLFEGLKNTFLLKYKPAYDENNEIIGVFVSSTEITKIKISQEQLQASESRFRSLINNANDIIYLTDKVGNISYISASLERVTGFTQAEMTGQSIFSLVHPDQKETSIQLLENIIQNPGVAFPRVTQFRHKNGHYIWVEGTVTNLLADPSVKAIVANYHDISHRKEIEEKLKENEERLKAIINSDPECVKIVDLSGKVLEMNPSGLKILEADSFDQLKGKEIINLVHPEDKESYKNAYKEACGGKNEIALFRAFTLKKNLIWVESHFVPLKKNNGEIYAILSVTRDITERKKSQERLEANEKRFRALVENGGDAMAIIGVDGIVNYISPSVKKVLGYSEEEVIKLNTFDLIHPEDLEKISNVISDALQKPGITVKGHTGRILHKDGSWRWCESYVTNMLDDPHIGGIVNNFRDVTESILAAEKLKHAENRFRKLIEHNYDGIILRDKNLNIIYGSSSAERILGWTNEDKLGKDFSDKTHPEDREKVQENIGKVLGNPGIPYPVIFRTLHKKGHYVWVERVMTNMLHDKTIAAIVANFRDITQKVNAEKQKEFDHSNLTALINNTSDLMWSISKKGVLISSNSAFDKQLKKKSGNDIIKGETFLVNGFDAEILKRWQSYYDRAYLGESFTIVEYTSEPIESWAEISFQPIHTGKEIIGAACYSRDISERKRSERKIENNTLNLLKIKNELENSEARLKKAQATAHVGHWEVNFISNNSIWSDELYSIYGLNPLKHKLSFEEWKEFIHPEDLEGFNEEFNNSRKTLRDSSHTHRIVQKGGQIKHLLTETRFELNTSGQLIGLYGTVLDITERVNAEKELIQSHELLQNLTSKVPVVVYKFQIDKEGNMSFPFMSDAILEILPDINTKKLKTDCSSLFEKVYVDDLDRLLTSIESSKTELSFWNIEFRAHDINNKLLWLHASSRPQKKPNGTVVWYGYIQDITEKKLDDENIRHAKERYDLVAKATNEAIWDWDLITGDLHWGDGFKNLFGYEIINKDLTNNSWSSRIHPEDKELVMNSIMAVVNSKNKSKWEHEYKYVKSDGSFASVYDRGYIIRNSSGKAIRMIGAMQDITSRKEEEQQLKLFESIITNTNDAVMITEVPAADGCGTKIIYVNEALTRISGYTKEEIIGNTPRMFLGPRSDLSELNKINTAILNNEPYSIEIINYAKNGNAYWVEIDIAPVTDYSGKVSHFITIERDITSRKVQEQEREKLIFELIQNNKDLRQFSYITSHNLRGPIANLLGLTNLLDNYEQTDPTLVKILSGVKKAALNFDETIKDLSSILNIKDRPSIPKEEIVFSSIHEKMIGQYSDIIKESNNTIKVDFSKAEGVHFNKAYLESIYSNLLTNAIKYRKRLVPLQITIISESDDDGIVLKFQDTGRGIDLETHKDKLFGLYQRFHPNTEGKGLGLFLIKSQLEALNGSISVESKIDEGTLFSLRFKNS